MKHTLAISIFFSHFNQNGDRDRSLVTPYFCQILNDKIDVKSNLILGTIGFYSPIFEMKFSDFSFLLDPLEEVEKSDSHQRWNNFKKPFFCMAYRSDFSEPILNFYLNKSEIESLGEESLGGKPMQIFDIIFSQVDQVDEGFSIKLNENDQCKNELILSSDYDAHLFYGYIRGTTAYSVKEYEELTGFDPILHWANSKQYGTETPETIKRAYDKMRSRFTAN